jgi:hypothetical protein
VLTALGLLAFVPLLLGQVSVETIGGGVRRECGPTAGFVAGNTWNVAQFGVPCSAALDSQGDLWVADTSYSALEDVTLAGNRSASITYHPSGSFPNVVGVAVDSADNLYVLTTTTLYKYYDVTGSFPNLNFLMNIPLSAMGDGSATAIAVGGDASTNIYISFTNSSGGSIVRIPQPYTGTYITMVAHYGFAPAGLSMRQDGMLAVTDTRNNAIYIIATAGGSSPVWITGGPGAGMVNGPPSLNGSPVAKFNQPRGIAASGDGRMVVCDTMNNALRVIDTANNTTTLYGTASNVWPAACCSCNPALYPGWVDGTAGTFSNNASSRLPVSVTIGPGGALFVTELYYSLIRSVAGSGLTPVISTNSSGSSTNLPTVTTLEASAITGTSAMLNASVDPGGSAATVYFQWGATTNYANNTTSTNLTANLGGTNSVGITLSGLQPNTVTHYEAVAINSGGTSYGGDRSLITPALGPAVITLAASNLTSSNAILSATVNPEGVPTSFYFEWGATTNYGNFTATNTLTTNLSGVNAVAMLLPGLQPNMLAHFQLVAINNGGTNYGGDMAFTTLALQPFVVTLGPSNVTSSNATLNATINPEGVATSFYFEWGTTTNYGNVTATGNLTTNLAATTAVALPLAGLQPNTLTHFQLVAINNGGTNYGGDFAFTTLSVGPTAITLAASNITSTNAILNASVNPENAPASYYFEWGATTNYGNLTATNLLTNNLGSNQLVSESLTNLSGGTSNHFQVVAFNSAGTNFGGDLTFITLPVIPVISINPQSGYYPECQTITVTSTVTNVYYTEDGNPPTTNSPSINNFVPTTNGLFIGTFQWCNAYTDLGTLQMIAMNGGLQSAVLTGLSPTANQLGFVRSPSAGIGSTAFIPLVLDLRSNYQIQSLEFRVEVTPVPPNTNPISSLSLVSVTANDFVQMVGAAPANAPVTFNIMPYAASSNGLGLAVYTEGSGSGLDIQNYGVVGLLEFQIPSSADTNQAYYLNIVNPSGTTGGFTNAVPMTPMPRQTVVVADIPYLVGDSTPATGYDAGEFGDGVLDNSDFNSAFYASMGIRVPPLYSDAFNAMDVWPQTATHNGDNKIDFQDWNHILLRSLGLDTNNWYRSWTPGGLLLGVETPEGLPSDPFVHNAVQQSPPGLVWQCQASIGAGTLTNFIPGKSCSLPVYAKILPGYSLAGFQFRAIVSGNGGAPPMGAVEFIPAPAISNGISAPGLSANDILQAWEIGSFARPLQNSNYLGVLNFVVPAAAQAGQSYVVHFVGVSGAPDDNTEYTMESFPGYVWVLSAALQQPSLTSDDWKINFFGSLTNPLAADNVDADGDGALNWQEYLAGTDPTNPLSVFQFSSAVFSAGGASGVALNWLTAPGKTYILQSIPALGGKSWTPINTNTGDGYNYQFIQSKYNGNAQFYRIQIQP